MASGVAKELETAITQIVAAALTGQITDPFARISVIVRAIFYPSFPESAKVQLMVVNGLQGLLLLGCLWTLWLRKGSLPLMRRVEGYLVPNTPIIFTTFMALYYAFAIVAVSRTIGIFEGKRTYPGLYIIRGLCWVWLYLAAWFRGLGTLIEAQFTSRAIQKSTGPRFTLRSTRLTSLFFTIFLPLIHVFWLLPLNGAVSALCDEAFNDYDKAYRTSLTLAAEEGSADFSIQNGVLQIMAPLESLAGSAGRCITSQRALYGSLCAWIVLTILSLGGTAFFLMYKKIRVQAKLHRRLDQDLQAITARQNVPMTLSGNKEKVRHMELATQDLLLQGLAFFGGSLSLFALAVTISVLGINGQIKGDWFAALNLWAWWTLAIFGFPAIIGGIRTALVERDSQPFFLQGELNAMAGSPSGGRDRADREEAKDSFSPQFKPSSWASHSPTYSPTQVEVVYPPPVDQPYPSYGSQEPQPSASRSEKSSSQQASLNVHGYDQWGRPGSSAATSSSASGKYQHF